MYLQIYYIIILHYYFRLLHYIIIYLKIYYILLHYYFTLLHYIIIYLQIYYRFFMDKINPFSLIMSDFRGSFWFIDTYVVTPFSNNLSIFL
jgi:hypothetical protein